ncbi:hypothetical protein BDL97_01G001100 [Sphagnum fallax]|nr:hypothetical protein BDL97_01G001100 [Sphagnum fallax]
MHRSTKVRHASKYVHSNIHLLLTTGHVWILSGKFYKYDGTSSMFYQNQDKIDIGPPLENNSIVRAGTKITSIINSRMTGLVKIEKGMGNRIKIEILPRSIYYPRGET